MRYATTVVAWLTLLTLSRAFVNFHGRFSHDFFRGSEGDGAQLKN
jgi:hypothetical protein